MALIHIPVLLDEILSALPERQEGDYLDVTAGGGGHLSEVLLARPQWKAQAWDRDPDARERVFFKMEEKGISEDRFEFHSKEFSHKPANSEARFDYILADLGVSSFQLDDWSRGMSLHSTEALDFRMDPSSGLSFIEWFKELDERKLSEIFYRYAEEPKAIPLSKAMKSWGDEAFQSAKTLADSIARYFRYGGESRKHPATRIFQALRIAVNDELGEVERFLAWAPSVLRPGGRLAVISFHSLEDRIVKNVFRDVGKGEGFRVLTKKPTIPTEEEQAKNPRSRSAKLRILERT